MHNNNTKFNSEKPQKLISGNFVVYKSSAGSGKTFTLVKHYLRIALSEKEAVPYRFKSILAITFTNDAAGELKERILMYLKGLSEFSQSGKIVPMREYLMKELLISNEELADRAAKLFSSLLHQYADFAVGTIDSFVHKVIRSFALDLKLPFNFQIESEVGPVLQEAIDRVVALSGEDEKITNLLLNYSREKIAENKSWQVDREIFSFIKKILDGDGSAQADSLREISMDNFLSIKKKMASRRKEIETKLDAFYFTFMEIINREGIGEEDFFHGERGLPGYFKKLHKREIVSIETERDKVVNGYVTKTITENKWTSKKDVATQQKIAAVAEEIRKLFYEAEEFRLAIGGTYTLFELLEKRIFTLALIGSIEKQVEEFKKERNIVLISEFNKRISEVVANEPVPFIYERVGERYKHYMVDEFQDTSVLQWLNLLPLIHNSLSEGYFNMIVGDAKQSIYRWRGGEVAQFVNLPALDLPGPDEIIREREKTLNHEYREEILKVNRRSKERIIWFNNSFFTHRVEEENRDEIKKVYQNLEQESTDENQGGLVTIDLLPKFDDSQLAEQNELEKVLSYVLSSLNLGYRYHQIAILCRSNQEGARVGQFLIQNHIPVVSKDSLFLQANDCVDFLFNFFKVIAKPSDQIAATGVINWLLRNTFFTNEIHEGLISKILDKNSDLQEEIVYSLPFKSELQCAVSYPLYEMTLELIRLFRLNDREPLYMQFFLDEISSYLELNNPSVRSFIEYWEDRRKVASVILPSELGAVNVLTIHASKGLEFPVVIIPGCNFKIDRQDDFWLDIQEKDFPELKYGLIRNQNSIKATRYKDQSEKETEKKILDEINTLYVAFTRAVNHLHIISRHVSSGASVRDWLKSWLLLQNKNLEVDSFFSFGEPMKSNEATIPVKSDDDALHWQIRETSHLTKIKTSKGNSYKNENERTLGICVHEILARINSREDLPLAIQKTELSGHFSCGEISAAVELIEKAFSDSEFSGFFGENLVVENEMEILLDDGSILRPDRVVFDNQNEVRIIDFKTGDKKASHQKQIDDYSNALEELGYKVRKKLIYYFVN